MAKVREDRRTFKAKRGESAEMARVIVAQKQESGRYRFRQKMVRLDDVQDELEALRD